MAGFRQTSLCKEGWYYLLVVLFILGGAALREVNLLVVLAGMLVAPAVFNWRLVSLSMRQLTLRRSFRRRICAGETLHVDLHAENQRRGLGSWAVTVQDSLTRVAPGARPTPIETLISYVAAGRRATARYESQFSQRGRYRLGPLTASTRFPLGLVRSSITFADEDELLVLPRLGRLSQGWNSLLETSLPGSRSSVQRHGLIDGDFYSMREWRSGDSRRWIHWRTTARLNELAVRQFEQQQRRDVALLIDLWAPEQPSPRQSGNVELAVSFAATAVSELGRRGGRRLRVIVCGEQTHRWSGAANGGFVQQTLDLLATVRPGAAQPLTPLLREITRRRRDTAQAIISTRSREQAENDGSLTLPSSAAQATWINVGDDAQRTQYFSIQDDPR